MKEDKKKLVPSTSQEEDEESKLSRPSGQFNESRLNDTEEKLFF